VGTPNIPRNEENLKIGRGLVRLQDQRTGTWAVWATAQARLMSVPVPMNG
jgi:hypothetical protein